MNKDRAAGVLVGLAVGDCLGAALEFKPRNRGAQIRDVIGGGVWAPGDPTDDTDQSILLAETLQAGWSPSLLLSKLLDWSQTAADIGMHTAKVMRIGDLRNPFKASEQTWIASGRSAAPNGSLMRTGPVGVFVDNPDRCAKIADEACRVTHWDPRCVSACVLVSEIIRQKVWEQPLKVEAQGEEVIATVRSAMKQEERAYDGHDRGFVLHTLHIAMRAFFSRMNFEEALCWVVNEGGDADTNGAVAGALLGARDGISAIPQRWKDACKSTERMLSFLPQ